MSAAALPWQTLHRCSPADPRDPITVDAVDLDGEALVLTLSHPGGCAEHRYGLCYSGDWDLSNPVMTDFTVLHDGGGDTCDGQQGAVVSFDLQPFRAAYPWPAGPEGQPERGAAFIRVAPCLHGDACRVLYVWGDEVKAPVCDPDTGKGCDPPFEFPEAPEDWIEHELYCGATRFQAPAEIEQVVRFADACIDEVALGPGECRLQQEASWYADPLVDDDYISFQVTLDGQPARYVTSRSDDAFAAVHFPDIGDHEDVDSRVTCTLRCDSAGDLEALLPLLGTLRFVPPGVDAATE